MMSDAQPLNIYQRLNKVREAVAFVEKDKQVGNAGWGYKAVTHDAVTAAVRPHFVTHGIIVVPRVIKSSVVVTGTTTSKGVPYIRYEALFSIEFINCDLPEDRVAVTLDSHAIDDADKAPGKATSYATKYAMLKLLSIETGEEEEDRKDQRKANMTITEKIAAANIKPTAGAMESLEPAMQKQIADWSTQVQDTFNSDARKAYALYCSIRDGKLEGETDAKVALRSLLPSNVRSQFQKFAQEVPA
jgi:hypothetical protein